MPDRTHNITVAILTVFYDNPCVLQHFIATGVPSFIPDDIIIATVTHFLMPDLTHIATVTYVLISAGTCSRCAVLGVIFTDNPHILA